MAAKIPVSTVYITQSMKQGVPSVCRGTFCSIESPIAHDVVRDLGWCTVAGY